MPQARVIVLPWPARHGIAQRIDDEFFGPRQPGHEVGQLHPAVPRADPCRHARKASAARCASCACCSTTSTASSRSRAASRASASSTVPIPRPADHPAAARLRLRHLSVLLHGLACWLVGAASCCWTRSLRCAEPAFSAEWRVLCARVALCCADSASAFDAACPAHKPARRGRHTKEFLRSAPANFLVKYKNSWPVGAHPAPAARPASGQLAQPLELARQLNLSEATLRRRLELDGSSYRAIPTTCGATRRSAWLPTASQPGRHRRRARVFRGQRLPPRVQEVDRPAPRRISPPSVGLEGDRRPVTGVAVDPRRALLAGGKARRTQSDPTDPAAGADRHHVRGCSRSRPSV